MPKLIHRPVWGSAHLWTDNLLLNPGLPALESLALSEGTTGIVNGTATYKAATDALTLGETCTVT